MVDKINLWKEYPKNTPESLIKYLVRVDTGKEVVYHEDRYSSMNGEWSESIDHMVTHWIETPKKKHQCGEEYECYIDEDGDMYLQVYDQHGRMKTLQVLFCPYCGEKN